MPTGTAFITATREAARTTGITLFDLGDPRQGIVHVISPEQAIVLPGLTLVCPDSHTCSQGALGALAWGIGSSEAEHALATDTLRVRKPRTMRDHDRGRAGRRRHRQGPGAAPARAVRLGGRRGARRRVSPGRRCARSEVEARLTLCNMATEFSAFTAIIAPDETTLAYLAGRRYRAGRSGCGMRPSRNGAALDSDADAVFDAELTIDAAEVAPMVTWGTNPAAGETARARCPCAGTERRSMPRARLYGAGAGGSSRWAGDRCCLHRIVHQRAPVRPAPRRRRPGGAARRAGRTRDLRARVGRGEGGGGERKGSTACSAPRGSNGASRGCSMCFFAGGESFGAGERVISSTNRNFESRQGPGTRSHLASPETVAASAIAGCIADPR